MRNQNFLEVLEERGELDAGSWAENWKKFIKVKRREKIEENLAEKIG